ncbi:hypothetical protein HYS31_00745 [Candidatus Woesearchaeota archaeon]|nr:hypothetical protein [Candidatus Woesearchaeota archaeon]
MRILADGDKHTIDFNLLRGASEIRTGSSGKQAIVPYTRLAKPEPAKDKTLDEVCVFCPDARHKLGEVYFGGARLAMMEDRGLYVIDNKFPTVVPPEITKGIDMTYLNQLSIFSNRRLARGRHLVMIETPNHYLDTFEDSPMTRNYYHNIVWGWIQMLRALRSEGYGMYEFGGVIKNRNGGYKDGMKKDAGDSQPHLHSQGIALDKTPKRIEEYDLPSEKYEKILKTDNLGKILMGCKGCIELRDLPLARENDGTHISYYVRDPDMPPYHSEIKIVPINHQSLFDEITDEQASSFADMLHRTMIALGNTYPDCGYNYELVQAPWKSRRDSRLYHWKFSIYPASPELETERRSGIMSHFLGIPVLKHAPEDIAAKIEQNRPKK